MRFGLLFALAATSTSAVQINVASVSNDESIATPASNGKLAVNKTRIKELADAEIKHHVN